MTETASWLVNVPVADLRREPIPHKGKYEKDALQESQLLFGERLHSRLEKGGWVCVEAVQQPKFISSENSWKGYPGWVQRKDLVPAPSFLPPNLTTSTLWSDVHASPNHAPFLRIPFGAGLSSIGQEGNWHSIRMPDGDGAIHAQQVIAHNNIGPVDRQKILEMGTAFVGCPYLWGGLTPFNPDASAPTGIDCSGLVHLLYRSQGVTIPRDAHDQFLACQKIPFFSQLQPADLVFLSEAHNPNRITHVMLYKGEESLLEATLDSHTVRVITAFEKLGRLLSKIQWGERLDQYCVFFGRFI